MTIRLDVVGRNPSKLDSWFAWRTAEMREYIVQKFDGKYVFPESLEMYHSACVSIHNGSSCPVCNDKLIVDHEKFGQFWCICEMLKWQSRVANVAGPYRTMADPKNFDSIKYNHLDERSKTNLTNTVEAAKIWASYPCNKWLLITGQRGCGKSHILVAIANILAPLATYINSSDLERLVFKCTESNTLSKFIEVLGTTPILILDDVGTEYGAKYAMSAFYSIIDFRYRQPRELPMVCASNLSAGELQNLGRIGSRVADVHNTVIIPMFVPSYREGR